MSGDIPPKYDQKYGTTNVPPEIGSLRSPVDQSGASHPWSWTKASTSRSWVDFRMGTTTF